MNENTHNPFNFSDILDRNHKKNEKTPVSNLLRSTTQEVMPKEIAALKEFDDAKICEKIDRLEGLVQSLIITQQNMQQNVSKQLTFEAINKQSTKLETNKEVQKDEKSLSSLFFKGGVLFILVAIFVTSLLILKKTQVKPAQVTPLKAQVSRYYLTKYVNLRSAPTTTAPKITTLPLNGIITIDKIRDGWNHISYKDLVKNQVYKGWIWGENFKKLQQ